MLNHNIAAKALIANSEGAVLCLKRRSNDVQSPSTWDIPGGRLDEGESPFDGLKRECVEEVGLDVEVQNPLTIHHFTRDDGQQITLIVFLCNLTNGDQAVKLSEEHTEYKWLPVAEAKELIHRSFLPDLEAYEKYFK